MCLPSIAPACAGAGPTDPSRVVGLDPATWERGTLDAAVERFGAPRGERSVAMAASAVVVDTAVAPAITSAEDG